MNKFFIVSTGRTGTLSLGETLNTIPQVHCTHEKFLNARTISNYRWDNKINENEASELVRKGLNKFIEPLSKGSKIVIDSNCLMWNFIDLVDKFDPNIGFIYIVRDPEETIQSMVNTGYYGATKFPWEKRAQKGYYNITDKDYDEEKHRLNCTFGYILRNNMIDNSLRNIEKRNPKRVLRLQFEDLKKDADAYLNKITGFIKDSSNINLDLSRTSMKHLHKSPKRK